MFLFNADLLLRTVNRLLYIAADKADVSVFRHTDCQGLFTNQYSSVTYFFISTGLLILVAFG